MLPYDLPNWRTVYFYYILWVKNAVWEHVNAALVSEERERKWRKAQPSATVCDSQSVKTTQKGGLAVTGSGLESDFVGEFVACRFSGQVPSARHRKMVRLETCN